MTSVLFPSGSPTASAEEPPACFRDLLLDDIVAAICDSHSDDTVKRLFYQPLQNVSAVEYRRQVFDDLERDEVLHSIVAFAEAMSTMRDQLRQADWVAHHRQRHGWFAHAVSTFCSAVTTLRERLARSHLTSRGLRDIADHLDRYVGGDAFRTLAAECSAALNAIGGIRYSVHIQGRRVRVEKYCGQPDYTHEVLSLLNRFTRDADRDYKVPVHDDVEMNPVEQRVLECVATLYPDAFDHLERFAERNQHFVESTIATFDREIHFYLLYSAFIKRLTAAGIHFCHPEVTDQAGTLAADHAYDLALATKNLEDPKPLIHNTFHLERSERVLVVTGPNQGGKTTFARTIGQCAYLAALGCPIPAKRAALTLPDAIYTHFDRRESLSNPHGKLHDELLRIRDILSHATATSLIIMNESFSSTTVNDALEIGTDIIRRIVKRDSTAVYVSFLDALTTVDPACVSMVAEVASDDPTRRTFTLTRRPADGMAYAAALADKYGLSYDVVRRRIR